jgi:hypothetical protein
MGFGFDVILIGSYELNLKSIWGSLAFVAKLNSQIVHDWCDSVISCDTCLLSIMAFQIYVFCSFIESHHCLFSF